MKKKAIILMAMLYTMMALPAFAQTYKSVTLNDVKNILASESALVSGYNVLYGTTSAKVLDKSSPSSYLESVLMSTSQEKYVVFVDMEPKKGWEHNCMYFYIPKSVLSTISTIPYLKVSATKPRTDLSISYGPIQVGRSETRRVATVSQKPLTTSELNAAGNTYAVILSGGVAPESNYARYWNDCSFIYKTLRNRFGIPKKNISVLMSDGTSPEKDMLSPYGYLVSSPTDLDGDGAVDITGAATKANLQSTLSNLASTMTSNDRLFFYVIDHGGRSGSSSYICLWQGEIIYDYELATLLNKIPAKTMNIVMGQCYSGGFVSHLEKYNRVIATACKENEVSWACASLPYDEFVYRWTSAINEADAYGNAVHSDKDDEGNSDGFVTMDEAFKYANANDTQPETPQYKIAKKDMGELWTFNKTSYSYDLMIRDNPEDDGTQPNTTTTHSYLSPDICQRAHLDGIYTHQTVQITDPYQQMYTYVKLTNIGSQNYNGSGCYLHLYWSNAILGNTLPGWLGMDNNPVKHGGKCKNSQQITVSIPVGSSVWVPVVWTIPDDVANYVMNQSGQFHLCLLARVSRSANDNDYEAMSDPNNDLQVGVLRRRAIAQKNLTIYSSNMAASQGLPLLMGNVYDTDREYNIEVIPSDGDASSLKHLEVAVELSDQLYKGWTSSGKMAERMASYASTPKRLYAQGTESKILDINMSATQLDKIVCYANVIADEDITEKKVYEYDIIQRDKLTGEEVGGERVQIVQEPRSAIVPQIDVKTEDGSYLVSETNVNEDARYLWYDEKGALVAEGKEAALPAVGKGCYTLKVVADKDGAVNYAQVSLEGAQGIKSLSPLPFSTQLSILLESPASENTRIRITPVTAYGASEEYAVKQGEADMTVYTAHFAKGVYQVALLCNGQVVDTKQVVKE